MGCHQGGERLETQHPGSRHVSELGHQGMAGPIRKDVALVFLEAALPRSGVSGASTP